MKRDSIEYVIRKRYGTLDRLFKKIIRTKDEEDIRQFRIEVKKLRAFLGMVTPSKPEGTPLGLSAKINKFYKAIGVLRGFQLQHELVSAVFKEKYSILPATYLTFLNRKIKVSSRIVVKLNEGKLPLRARLKDIIERRVAAGKPAAVEFVRIRQKVMNELLNPFFEGDETLHSIRKILKDVLHNWPYIKTSSTLKKGFSIFPGVEDVKMVSKLLGDFQNKCSALALLYEYDPKK